MIMEPKIRFFKTEHWNCFPFSEIAVRKSTSAISEDQPYVEYEDIISGEGTLNKDLRTKAGSKRGILFTKGDVLFGKLRPYLKNILYAEFDGVAVGDFWVLRSDKIVPKLLYILVNSNNFMKVANISSGSKMPRADWNLVSSTKFYIPQSKDEQRALATFFTSLDNQISAAEKRLASLKQVKAASLQAMFPQEGETTPKLRFKGCEGEWKKVKLGEIVRLKAGNSLSLAQLKEWGSYPCYGGNGIRTYLPFFSHDGEYNLIGRVGALCGNINYVNGKFYATEHALVVYPFDDINVRFLFYVLVFADLNKYKKGCAQPVLSASTLYNVDIIIPPSLPEQRQIASYFTSLDHQITAQSSKISKLKQIKSACLDQMFV